MFGVFVGNGWEVGCHPECFSRASLEWWSQGGQFITGNVGFLENVLKVRKWTRNWHLIIHSHCILSSEQSQSLCKFRGKEYSLYLSMRGLLKKKLWSSLATVVTDKLCEYRSNSMHYFCFDARALFNFVFWETGSCMLYHSTMQTYFKTFHVIP